MRQFAAIAFLSVLAFAAGYGVRIWVDHTRPLPGPPGPFMGEFAGPRPAAAPSQHPPNRADLAAQIERLRPQMEAYHTRMAEIDAEFERSLQGVLTADQNARHAERLKRQASRPPRPAGPDDNQPLTDEQINWLRERSLYGMFRNITLQMKIDDLNKELKLDASQQDRVRELLRTRREQFLTLVDSVPPPSLTLVNLAPVAQRLAAPKGEPSASPKP